MIHKLLCKIGIHSWKQYDIEHHMWDYRKCSCCKKKQSANPYHVIWEDE